MLILLELFLPTWTKNVASVKKNKTPRDEGRLFATAKSQGFILRWSQSKIISADEIFQHGLQSWCLQPLQLSCWTGTGDKSSPWTPTAGVRTGAAVSPRRQTVTCHRAQQRTSTQNQSANGAWQGRESERWSWGRGLVATKMRLTPWFIPSSRWSMLIPGIHTAWSVYRSGFLMAPLGCCTVGRLASRSAPCSFRNECNQKPAN